MSWQSQLLIWSLTFMDHTKVNWQYVADRLKSMNGDANRLICISETMRAIAARVRKHADEILESK